MNIEIVHLTNPNGMGFSDAAVAWLRAFEGVTRVEAQNPNASGRYADVLLHFRSREDREEFNSLAAAVASAADGGER